MFELVIVQINVNHLVSKFTQAAEHVWLVYVSV
jgi:hypothetical protein